MFNCVRPPERQREDEAEPQQKQQSLPPHPQQLPQADGAADGAAAPSGSHRRPTKLRVRLRLRELVGVTLSHGVVFAKVRLLSGGRFCQFSEHREIRDNKVSWADLPPMEFQCRLGPGAPPAHLRVSVRREERGGRSYTKVGYAVIDISDLPWVGDTEHKCILSPYSQGQRLDNSTVSFTLHPAVTLGQCDLAGAPGAACSPQLQQLLMAQAAGAAPSPAVLALPASTSSTALASLGGGGGFGHRRNASNFSACSVRTHSRNNSLEQQDPVFTCNSSQSSSVPSFDLMMPSSLERRRTGLTPTRELNSRIANTRSDNFQIVREVLEREGILLGPGAGDA